jgi:hypothetical protein
MGSEVIAGKLLRGARMGKRLPVEQGGRHHAEPGIRDGKRHGAAQIGGAKGTFVKGGFPAHPSEHRSGTRSG